MTTGGGVRPNMRLHGCARGSTAPRRRFDSGMPHHRSLYPKTGTRIFLSGGPRHVTAARSGGGKAKINTGRGESMSDRERELIHKLETFPQELRERFFDRLEGAAMALEALQREANDEK